MPSCLKTINQSWAWNATKATLHLFSSASPLLKVTRRITATVRNDPDSQFLPHYRWAPFTSHIHIVPRQRCVVIVEVSGSGSISAEGGGGAGWCSRKRKNWEILKYLLLAFPSNAPIKIALIGSHWAILLSNARNLTAPSLKTCLAQ